MEVERIRIEVEILFYRDGKSHRETPPILTNRVYRPHLIVKGTKVYLGVWFVEGGIVELGMRTSAVVETIYDNVNYNLLFNSDTGFYIIEGRSIVGEGKIIKRLTE